MGTERDFSERLIALSKKFDLTQLELAAALKASHSFIHQLESGKRVASDKTIMLVDLWEQLEDLKRARAGNAPATESAPVLREEARAYDAPRTIAFPFPIPPDLAARVHRVAAAAHVSPEAIAFSALEQYLQKAESEGTVTLNISRSPPAEPDSKRKGAA